MSCNFCVISGVTIGSGASAAMTGPEQTRARRPARRAMRMGVSFVRWMDSGELSLVEAIGLVTGAGHGAERDVRAIPRVDRHHGPGEIGNFLLRKLRADVFVDRVGY